MPVNKSALIRYQILDRCLRDTGTTWTLEQLTEEVSDVLVNEYGKKSGISKSSIEKDLRFMKSEAGYSAPIENEKTANNWVYYYTNSKFTITNSPLDKDDAGKLKEILSLLRQFEHLPQFNKLEEILLKLESRNITKKGKINRPLIQFDSNPMANGIHLVRVLHKHIIRKIALCVGYQAFNKPQVTYIVSPLLIKEYNNRWFLFSKNHETGFIQNLPLDRSVTLEESFHDYNDSPEFEPEEYFKNIIGVSLPSGDIQPEKIRLRFTSDQGNYVKTKPIHWSQRIIAENKKGLTIELTLIPNYELKKVIWGFGDTVEVFKLN